MDASLEANEQTPMQLCVACNKLQASSKTSCDCGHVLREALTLKEENSSRKRRAPYRANSVNTEWLTLKERSEIRMALKNAKQNENNHPQQDKNNNLNPNNAIRQITQNPLQHTTNNGPHKPSGRPKKHGNAGRKKSRSNLHSNNTNNSSNHLNNTHVKKNADDAQRHQQDFEKQNKLRELIDIIENSYQNVYFNRCKSYKKAKLADLEFEFDFSTFDSRDPYYPTALEDINTKINRTNKFWKNVC